MFNFKVSTNNTIVHNAETHTIVAKRVKQQIIVRSMTNSGYRDPLPREIKAVVEFFKLDYEKVTYTFNNKTAVVETNQ